MSSLSRPARSGPNSTPARRSRAADLAQLGGGAARGQHRLDDVARPRAGGEHVMQVGDGVGHRGEHRRRIEDAVGAGRVAPCLLLRPAVARRDQAQMEQPAIRHGARAGADIVGKLRPHQDDDRRTRRSVPARRRRRGRSFRVLRLPGLHEGDLLLLRGDDAAGPVYGAADPCRIAARPSPCRSRPDGARSCRRRSPCRHRPSR